MAKQKWIIEMSVDNIWIADGFNRTNERAQRMLENDLQFAFSHEVSAKVLAAPCPHVIARLQGYKTVKAMMADRKVK